MKEQNKKFVVLEHLRMPDRGFRFFSMNNREDNTILNDGVKAYKEIGFVNTIKEAQSMLGPNLKVVPTLKELQDYLKNQR